MICGSVATPMTQARPIPCLRYSLLIKIRRLLTSLAKHSKSCNTTTTLIFTPSFLCTDRYTSTTSAIDLSSQVALSSSLSSSETRLEDLDRDLVRGLEEVMDLSCVIRSFVILFMVTGIVEQSSDLKHTTTVLSCRPKNITISC